MNIYESLSKRLDTKKGITSLWIFPVSSPKKLLKRLREKVTRAIMDIRTQVCFDLYFLNLAYTSMGHKPMTEDQCVFNELSQHDLAHLWLLNLMGEIVE